MSTTYSFKDLGGGFNDPDVGPFSFSGEIGFGEIVVTMLTERIVHNVAADGTVMISYIAGENGSIDIHVQQVSDFHDFLINWANTKFSNANAGNVTTLAGATITLRNTLDGTQHVLTGVTPTKIPDKRYAAEGGMIAWRLLAAKSQQFTVQ